MADAGAPPDDWVYHDDCWCQWCVASRAEHGGSPEPFHQVQEPESEE